MSVTITGNCSKCGGKICYPSPLSIPRASQFNTDIMEYVNVYLPSRFIKRRHEKAVLNAEKLCCG